MSAPAWAAPTLGDTLRLHNVQVLDPPPAAPPINLPGVDGKAIALNAYKGQWVLLTFFATWCGPCASEMPSLQRLHESMQGKGLQILAVAVDPEDDILGYVRKRNLTFPVALDTHGQAASAYQASSIPVAYLINPEGKVVGVAQGARDWQAASTLIDALLAQAPATRGTAQAAAPPALPPLAPAPPPPMALPEGLVPPEATARLVEPRVTVGKPFHVEVTVRWAGSLTDYILLPPSVALAGTLRDLGTAATTNTEQGRATLVYTLTFQDDVAEPVKLDPIEVRYVVAGQKDPLSRHIAGPTVNVEPFTIAGQKPGTWAGILAGVAVLGSALTWLLKRRRRQAQPVAAAVGDAHSSLEAIRLHLVNGEVPQFLRGIAKVLPADSPQQVELAALIQAAQYGGQKPDGGTLDRLLRAAQRHVESLAQNPQSRAEHHS